MRDAACHCGALKLTPVPPSGAGWGVCRVTGAAWQHQQRAGGKHALYHCFNVRFRCGAPRADCALSSSSHHPTHMYKLPLRGNFVGYSCPVAWALLESSGCISARGCGQPFLGCHHMLSCLHLQATKTSVGYLRPDWLARCRPLATAGYSFQLDYGQFSSPACSSTDSALLTDGRSSFPSGAQPPAWPAAGPAPGPPKTRLPSASGAAVLSQPASYHTDTPFAAKAQAPDITFLRGQVPR